VLYFSDTLKKTAFLGIIWTLHF